MEKVETFISKIKSGELDDRLLDIYVDKDAISQQ